MHEEYASKLEEDLRKRLDRLCLMHYEPDFHVEEHFAELRRQVDLDAEKRIEIAREEGDKNAIVQVNGKRMQFIGILDELEKRTCTHPKIEVGSSEITASLEQRVEAFRDSSSSLNDLEDTYVQLAREIIAETDRVEKSIFGEQTTIYWPHQDESELGSLVYFGDVFLSKRDIDYHLSQIFPNANTRRPQTSESQLLVPAREPRELNKKQQALESLPKKTLCRFAEACKFYYIGKTETEYSGYAAEGSTIDKEFISYQRKDTGLLQIEGHGCLDTSANLFDIYSSTTCTLWIVNRRLENLHVNLLPSPATRLHGLVFTSVHFESFDTTLLSQFTNLTALKMQATTFSKDVKFDLEFLRPLRKLTRLELTLPGSSWNFSAFESLTELRNLELEGSSYVYAAEKLPRLSKAALEQILSPPELQSLKLSCFDIETIDRDVFNGCRRLARLELARSRIDDLDACTRMGGFPLCFTLPEEKTELSHLGTISFNLLHSGIRVLSAASFVEMKSLRCLSLTGNSIVDLPRGLFQDLPSLDQIELDKNLIRHVSSGVFGKLESLTSLYLGANPIETIEANAFAQLDNLRELSLQGCRLKSIDSEMFNGLKRLCVLKLNRNLIERIEVVAADGRRINVAKANLNDEEKQLVKKHLFTDFSCLFRLYLGGNKLEKLDLNCFNNLKILKNLNVSSNKINELSGEAGPELLCRVRELTLSDNQLTAIDQSALPKGLHQLNLAKNRLKLLDDDFFAEFCWLESVNLSENELTWTITEETFARCRDRLVYIDVSLNESIQVTNGAFGGETSILHNFKCDFTGNFCSPLPLKPLRIRRLTPEVVRGLKRLCQFERYIQVETCFLAGCSIKILKRNSDWKEKSELDETPDLDHFNLSWVPNAWKLRELDLSGNLIEILDDASLFCDFGALKILNLSNNRLSSINRDIFKCLCRLETIDLSGNQLSSIDMGLFRPLISLTHLNLSSNNIAFLNLARLFCICPGLKSVNIANNQLDERQAPERVVN